MHSHAKYERFTLEQVKRMQLARNEGLTIKDIAREFDADAGIVGKHLRHYHRYGDSMFSDYPTETGKCPQCGSRNVKASVCGMGFVCRNCSNRWSTEEQ